MGGGGTTKQRCNPLRSCLIASNESLGSKLSCLSALVFLDFEHVINTYDACLAVDDSGNGVDTDDMSCLVVPRTIFAPVRGGNLIPRVVKGTCRREDLHGV